MPDVVVVGGGIGGLSLALELAILGARATIVEARYPGAGNSTRNVGRIRRMQLTPELTRYSVRALEKWRTVHRLIGGRNPLLFPTTYAWILYGGDEVDRLAPLEPMWRDLDARARLVAGDAALRAVPILRGGEQPVGAVLGEAALVHHDAAVYGYLQACLERGVRILTRTRAENVVTSGGRITGVVTSAGVLAADAVVNAAGGAAGAFARACGLDPPNRPVRREVLVTEPSKPFVTPVVTFYRPQEGWFNQTLRGELVAGVVDPDEPDAVTEASSFRFLGRTARIVLEKAPALASLRVIRQWAGVYDLTPDKLPLLGEHEVLPGLWAMSGWSGRGFALAPVSAEILARAIVRDERDPLLELTRPDRFVGRPEAAAPGDYYSAYDRQHVGVHDQQRARG